MYLRPSEVFYSQDSINNVFDKRCNHRYKPIGETLDEICEGRSSVYNIPAISVVEKDGKWITADNRRLWVFRQLERLGKCEKIHVQKGYYIPSGKLTSYNGGASVRVRGSPGGYWHLKPSVTKQTAQTKNVSVSRKIEYADTNIFKKPDTHTPNIFSSNRMSPDLSSQFSRASVLHSGGYGNYGNTTGSIKSVENSRSSGNTSLTETNNHNDMMFPRATSSIRKSPVASYQSVAVSNYNKERLDSYGRKTGAKMNDDNMFGGQTSYPGRSAISTSSSSGRESTNYSKVLNQATHHDRENDEYSARRAQEQRVYRHKTYDNSYNGNYSGYTTYSDRERNNGCCIII